MVIVGKPIEESLAIDERQTALDEMARVCKKADGYGIVVEIYSRDHGTIGNPRQPAHAHLFDTNMRPKGEFVISPGIPQRPSDVVWYRTNNPPAGYAEKIVKWAQGSRSRYGINNWAHALCTWEDHHP
jgi:hypothetical protein